MPDRSTQVAQGPLAAAATEQGGRGSAPALLVAGMNGDLHAWEEGLLLACGVELGEAERQRLDVVGGPPPVALENVLSGLGTSFRPYGHLRLLRLLAEGYRLALDGDRDVLRWLEAALGHPDRSLGRADLLGPHGLPLQVQHLGADLEPGPLPGGWLDRVDCEALAELCSTPAEATPVWAQLQEVGEDAAGPTPQ